METPPCPASPYFALSALIHCAENAGPTATPAWVGSAVSHWPLRRPLPQLEW